MNKSKNTNYKKSPIIQCFAWIGFLIAPLLVTFIGFLILRTTPKISLLASILMALSEFILLLLINYLSAKRIFKK